MMTNTTDHSTDPAC